ncbi:MAG: radical SAM family heme chaperone HemW [Halanaerobiales bacterium]
MKEINNFEQPISLYIHVPFCTDKCSYCDFYSIKYNQSKIKKFIRYLKKEIIIYGNKYPETTVKTLYFGGGTPSLLSPSSINEILNCINDNFNFVNYTEITLESNPETLTTEKIAEYNKNGVNRLSMGVQSLNDSELKLLGRNHSSKKAKKMINIIKEYFKNYNIDLIFSIPGQNILSWQETLNTILKFKPPHISTYNLQIEEGSRLKDLVDNGQLIPVSEKNDAEIYKKTINILKNSGYNHYEISNFAKTNYNCRHNLQYWQYEPYIGLGPSAHGFTGFKRYKNFADVNKYFSLLKNNSLPIAQFFNLDKKELMSEMMIMGLRLIEGVSKKRFQKRFNVSISKIFGKEIKETTEKGLIIEEGDKIKLTRRGIFLANQVFLRFLPPE